MISAITASLPPAATNSTIMSRGNATRKSAFTGAGPSKFIASDMIHRNSGSGPSTSAAAAASLYMPDYSTDYDSEVARLLPSSKDTNVNSSDTEDASEDGEVREGNTVYGDDAPGSSVLGSGPAIKEQVYLDKLEQLKSDLRELEEGRHPHFINEFEKVEQMHADWDQAVETDFLHDNQLITSDFCRDQRSILREFEEKKCELKEGLIMNMVKQREIVDVEQFGIELDPTDLKPASTRKLRRRPNDPVPVPEKNRRKPPQSQITFLLDDNLITSDFNEIRGIVESGIRSPTKKARQQQRQSPPRQSSQSGSKSPSPIPNSDTRIEDGKLFYEKRWFHRGQPIFLEGKEMLRVIGVIGGISQDTVWVRKVGDNSTKLRVPLIHLMKGKLTIKRRA